MILAGQSSLIFQYTLIYTSVFVLVALGGMFSERSGIINLGLEGIMVIGALAGAVVSNLLLGHVSPFFNVVISVVCSMAAGLLFSMLLAVACITFNADQTITGTAINIMSTALAVIIARMYTGTPSAEIGYTYEYFLFANGKLSWFLVMMIFATIVSYLYLFKTKYGIHLMACGEHPHAADSVGINVYRQRYLGVAYSGILAGLGGFAYIIQSAGRWDFRNGVSGYGFLALAVMIFGQWKPIGILLAGTVFGFSQTIAKLYAGSFGIPPSVYKMFPYLVCMIVLALTSKHSKAPRAEGQVYEKGMR